MFPRIVSDPAILNGKPCVRGTRISVEFILELIAGGGTRDEVVSRYPQLTAADVEEAVRYAAAVLRTDGSLVTRVAG